LPHLQLIRDLNKLPSAARGGAVAIGNFDGVHRGHAQLVARLIAQARQVGGPAVVFTFDPHPVRILRPEQAPPPLTWTDRKAQLLAELGVQWIVAYPTDEALLSLTDRQFFERIVRDRLDARALVEGSNFYFGRDRMGTIDVLRTLCDESGLLLEIVQAVQCEGAPVSSSRIRSLLMQGDVASAARLLTRPYRIRGMVTHGAGRGSKIGFPTANVAAIDTLLPAHGVYAGCAIFGDRRWPAAINLGPAPTFSELSAKVEVHLIGADLDLYHQPLEVEFLERLRDIQAFAGVDALVAQLQRDVQAARTVVATHESRDQGSS
jgi:riboflavin kinase/FMN adenylyltransferase